MNGQLFIHYSFAYNFVKTNLHSNVAAKPRSASFVSIAGAKPRSVAFRLYCGDASLQSFFTAASISKIGEFNSIDELIRGNDFASANFRNSALQIDRLSETNLQTVNRIIIQQKGNFDNIDSVSYFELLAIAYQFPSIGGEAVFRARAILRIDVDDTELMLRLNSSKDLTPINLVKIVPNPSKGKFRIVDAAGSTQRKYQYSISDDKGRLVKENSDQRNTNTDEIDLSNFNPGIYFAKVILESGEIQNLKLVLIK